MTLLGASTGVVAAAEDGGVVVEAPGSGNVGSVGWTTWQQRIKFNEFGVEGGPAAKALKPKFNIKYLVAAGVASKGVGRLLFIFGGTMGAYLLAVQQVIITPILYDFYNYDTEKKEFDLLFSKFSQNLALLGALLFFIGTKNTLPRRQLKKKAPKTKTV
ncbi:putative 2-oxoglutarate (2OG) and Fe(II)-dependent oxygenase superfamily protein [Hibiscus syriacus]|uniref:2-oxoglutarate (2OG) and Fe(II)-dependent oxygenase superfamily protein n=1 Tax=Hibiscus syriacus TaxID=106335 RepID=A0A6A3CFJ7_HIBSY|nr:putative 2-oxoglutarate (2OG) and Fe(II)-dependent oxygenase superfamily protein [Hibiscus syriacus]